MMKRIYVLALSFIGQASYALGRTNGDAPVVDLGYVKYRGVQNATAGINTWYGIHYAQPPTGDLRWNAPQDIELQNNYSSSDILDATQLGPSCAQLEPAWIVGPLKAFFDVGPPTSDEDCLLLDVLTPVKPASNKLPVMVQIHGGGYVLGSTETFQGPGAALVNQSMGHLVYVSIQYRLGAFGFLGGQGISENGTLNAGVLDQRAALNWVQRHISKFGGDPSRVTIIGGSAGGGSVANQMILFGGVSNPPFRAGIADYPELGPYHDQSFQDAQYMLLLKASGCSSLSCLRSLSFTHLSEAANITAKVGYSQGLYADGDFFYGPVVDGSIIRDLPSNELKQGHFTKVPLLTDREGYEGYIFSNKSETTKQEETMDLQRLFPSANQSFFTQLYELYPRSSFNSTFFQRQQIYGDSIINCPTYYLASALSDYGQPVYKLYFDAGSELHGALQPFVESIYTQPTGNNATLANILRDFYVSFATSLDPNTHEYSGIARPNWPTYQQKGHSKPRVLSITYTTISTTPDRDASARCDFFHGHSNIVRN